MTKFKNKMISVALVCLIGFQPAAFGARSTYTEIIAAWFANLRDTVSAFMKAVTSEDRQTAKYFAVGTIATAGVVGGGLYWKMKKAREAGGALVPEMRQKLGLEFPNRFDYPYAGDIARTMGAFINVFKIANYLQNSNTSRFSAETFALQILLKEAEDFIKLNDQGYNDRGLPFVNFSIEDYSIKKHPEWESLMDYLSTHQGKSLSLIQGVERRASYEPTKPSANKIDYLIERIKGIYVGFVNTTADDCVVKSMLTTWKSNSPNFKNDKGLAAVINIFDARCNERKALKN